VIGIWIFIAREVARTVMYIHRMKDCRLASMRWKLLTDTVQSILNRMVMNVWVRDDPSNNHVRLVSRNAALIKIRDAHGTHSVQRPAAKGAGCDVTSPSVTVWQV